MKRMERQWMYKRLDERRKVRIEFVNGVDEFIEYNKTQRDFQHDGCIRCPCHSCKNLRFHDIRIVKEHLYTKGFCANYFEWVSHGEKMTNVGHVNVKNVSTSYENMVRDAFPSPSGYEGDNGVEVEEEPNPKSKEFLEMLNAAQQPLYDGCKRTLLESASRMIDMKCDFNLPHRCVDRFASMMDDFLPEDNLMTRTFYNTKKILKGLQLPVEKIHVCPKGCMLYWKDDVNLENCKVCGEDRYKLTSRGKQKAKKILNYFPITPRLQRLYASANTAEQMRWHADNPRVSGTMAHPSDGEAWKHFDRVYPNFASDPRNVRLGLCTDGFTPYGKFGGTYSCWPVILTPYNLPPWLCMKKEFMFLSMIIPGPKAPKSNLDVYLQPLIEELNYLWATGETTFDVSRKQNFTLKAALMWTISDFPAYGMLSGWSTSGKYGCPCCMKDTHAFSLKHGHKLSWFDCHRKFLPPDHPYRRNKRAFYKDRVETRGLARKNEGRFPAPVQAFLHTHSKITDTGERVYSSKKAKAMMDEYELLLAEYAEEGVVKSEAEVWYEAVGGRIKGKVYGLGQATNFYYESAASSSYSVSSSYSSAYEFQRRMAAYEAEMESMRSQLGEMNAFKAKIEALEAIIRDRHGTDVCSPAHSQYRPDDRSSGAV